jgi:hypothetical protein
MLVIIALVAYRNSDIVTEQYTVSLPSTVAFRGKLLKLFTLHSHLLETFSIPSSLLSVTGKSPYIRQTLATIYREKAILIQLQE